MATISGHCNTCDKSWQGGKVGHCATCHETFSTIGAFDRHRKDGHCINPVNVGLVSRTKYTDGGWPWTLWGFPGNRFDTDGS